MDSSALDAAFRLTVGAIFLLLLPALFSGSETALNAASRGKLRAQADKGSAGAAEALRVTERQGTHDRRAASGQQHRHHRLRRLGNHSFDPDVR
jgi:hypothetical protein